MLCSLQHHREQWESTPAQTPAAIQSPPTRYNSSVTRERWAQIGITVQFLIIVRTLGEIFRLRHVNPSGFSLALAMPYIGGALIAACFCWAGVILYFFRRYLLASSLALATVVVLLVYKIAVIGR